MNSRLQVAAPYYCQLDSRSADLYRMCFSACDAMLTSALCPDALGKYGLPEDNYLAEVHKHGDSTNPGAQVAALLHFGIAAVERTNCAWADVDAQLMKGVPVPMGILHHGPITAPCGGGHWILCIGRTDDGRHVYHDPYGELDVVNGGYPHPGTGGKAVVYSDANLGRRWSPEGPGHGWAMIAHKVGAK